MSNSKTVKFKKDSIIFIDGQEPKYMFYIIIKGKVEAYSYFADNYTFQYKEGDIIGFYNAVINEPFIFTVKALEDTELLEMNIQEIENINNKYRNSKSAIEILEIGESVMMTITPSTFGTLSAIYDKKRKKKISKAMLQTLSIIAYKQPLTKAEIDDIRQSDSGYHLRVLMDDGFIAWKGRKDYLDKRQTYGTTDKFLMHFGINTLEDLPKLRELKDLEFNRYE